MNHKYLTKFLWCLPYPFGHDWTEVIKAPFLTQKVPGKIRDIIIGQNFIIALKEASGKPDSEKNKYSDVSGEPYGAAALDHFWPVCICVFPLHLLSFDHVPVLPFITFASFIVCTHTWKTIRKALWKGLVVACEYWEQSLARCFHWWAQRISHLQSSHELAKIGAKWCHQVISDSSPASYVKKAAKLVSNSIQTWWNTLRLKGFQVLHERPLLVSFDRLPCFFLVWQDGQLVSWGEDKVGCLGLGSEQVNAPWKNYSIEDDFSSRCACVAHSVHGSEGGAFISVCV